MTVERVDWCKFHKTFKVPISSSSLIPVEERHKQAMDVL